MTRTSACQREAEWAEQVERDSFKTLIIGDLDRWSADGRETTAFSSFAFITIDNLNTDILRDFAPQMVLSPLMGDDFDVFEIASLLRRLGYRGCYRAISPQIPNVDVIRSDIAEVAPDLDFDLLLMPYKGD